MSDSRGRDVRAPMSTPGGAIGASVAVLVSCACIHGALRVLGRSFSGRMRDASAADVLADAGLVALLIVAATVAVALSIRCAPTRRLRLWLVALAIAYVAIGWRLSLLPDDLHFFGALSTYAPNTTLSESVGGGPLVTYRINALGFRRPDFAERRSEARVRVALVGDSFVFGIGVDEDGTLRHHLAAEMETRYPQRHFEVLNLGIPGNNLASHVELVRTATARLAPDAVVLCLTLANDLSRWDEQAARRDARRLSGFSLVRFLAGDGAAEWLWASLFLERTVTAAGLAFLDRQLARLEEERRGSAEPPFLALFGFFPWDPAVAARLQAMEGVVLIPDRTTLPEEFIFGDGHPTSIGNRRSAARIADTLAESESWRRLLEDGSRASSAGATPSDGGARG